MGVTENLGLLLGTRAKLSSTSLIRFATAWRVGFGSLWLSSKSTRKVSSVIVCASPTCKDPRRRPATVSYGEMSF